MEHRNIIPNPLEKLNKQVTFYKTANVRLRQTNRSETTPLRKQIKTLEAHLKGLMDSFASKYKQNLEKINELELQIANHSTHDPAKDRNGLYIQQKQQHRPLRPFHPIWDPMAQFFDGVSDLLTPAKSKTSV